MALSYGLGTDPPAKLLHIEDGGDLSVFINDDGDHFFRCMQCGQMWPCCSFAGEASRDVTKRLTTAVQRSRDVMMRAGVDVDNLMASMGGKQGMWMGR